MTGNERWWEELHGDDRVILILTKNWLRFGGL